MQQILEPDLLRTFVTIAEGGSFTTAAARVGRTQSAVSMQIKRLEDAIGRQLFEREGRAVRLSRDGEMLLSHARRILRAHQEALSAFDPNGLRGQVTIGAPDDYASSFLPRILARFAASYPNVHVTFVCRSSAELVHAVADGEVDLALITQGSGEPAGTLVRREPLVWAVSAQHRPYDQTPLPLAVFHQSCIFRASALESLAEAGRPARIAYTSVSVAGIYAALEAGLAVGVLLRGSLRPGLRALTEEDGFPRLPEVGIVLLRGERRDPVIDRLEAEMRQHFCCSAPLSAAA